MPDVQTMWNNYLSSITAAHHHFFRKAIYTPPPSRPAMDHRRNQAPQAATQPRPSDRLYKSVQEATKKAIREIKLAKRNYYPDKLQHIRESDSSKGCGQIKQLCALNNKSSTLPCPSHRTKPAAAHEANHHFAPYASACLA